MEEVVVLLGGWREVLELKLGVEVWARIGARQTQPELRDTHFHSTVFGSLSSFFLEHIYTPNPPP